MTPRTLAAFRGSTLMLPDVRMLEEAERDALRAQVSRGARLVVTGTDATGLAPSDALTRFPECPGRAYLADLEKDFGKADPFRRSRTSSRPSRRIHTSASKRPRRWRPTSREWTGSSTSSSPTSRASSPGRTPFRRRSRESASAVPAASAGKAWFLPFLGEAQEVEGQRHDGNLVFVLPDVQKGAVVWFEPR